MKSEVDIIMWSLLVLTTLFFASSPAPSQAQNREAALAALMKLPAAELQVHTVERAKAQGAPVEWSVLDGVIPISKVGAGITSTGANVYSSALFYDFLLSRPGMETIRASRRIPTRPDVTAPYLKPYKLLPFEQSVMDDFDKYVALFRETFKPGR
jgi:hypothetical protein